jgi:hypothetical protein
MIIEPIVCAGIGFFGAAAIEFVTTRVRARRLRLAEAARTKQLSASETKLEEWKGIFRETVIATDGELSPEMESFLAGANDWTKRESEISAKCLSQARAQAKRELDELLSRDNSRLVIGDVREAFVIDWNAGPLIAEKIEVVQRWCDNGYEFPLAMRTELISKIATQDGRDELRDIFDENTP